MYKTGFIGTGKMATALASAFVKSQLVKPQNIICYDPVASQREKIQTLLNVNVTDKPAEVIQSSDIIILAFKPQNFPDALAGLSELIRPDQIIISILAGIRLSALTELLHAKVVRVMPNTACLVSAMAAGMTPSGNLTPQETQQVRNLLETAGIVITVPENLLDAVTALSGSGPAFVAYIVDCFARAAQTEGLNWDTAYTLALQTFAGTAKLLREMKLNPDELIKMVSSPHGTTVAGREVLESSPIDNIIQKTISRAAQRSRELGNQ